MERFSQKRQSIMECLSSTTEHPSAEWIYSKLKSIYPRLSLATVYRNLKQLEKEGLIRSVGIVDGQERYDANTSPHTHMICVRCGRVSDAFDIELPETIGAQLETAHTGFTVLHTQLNVSGICERCRKKER